VDNWLLFEELVGWGAKLLEELEIIPEELLEDPGIAVFRAFCELCEIEDIDRALFWEDALWAEALERDCARFELQEIEFDLVIH
jgi:hypothetical protein